MTNESFELKVDYILFRPKCYGKRLVQGLQIIKGSAHLTAEMTWTLNYYMGNRDIEDGPFVMHCHCTKSGRCVCDRIEKIGKGE